MRSSKYPLDRRAGSRRDTGDKTRGGCILVLRSSYTIRTYKVRNLVRFIRYCVFAESATCLADRKYMS